MLNIYVKGRKEDDYLGYYVFYKMPKGIGINLGRKSTIQISWKGYNASIFDIHYWKQGKLSVYFSVHRFMHHRRKANQPVHEHADRTWSIGLWGGYVEWYNGKLKQHRAPWFRRIRTPHRTRWVPGCLTLFLEIN